MDIFNSPAALENVEVLGKFLKYHPNVGENLKAAGVGWQLSSTHPQIGGFGGAAVIEDRIHIANSVLGEGDTEGFGRMAVHETGHATFQRLLVRGENWTEEANKGEKAPDDKALVEDGKTFYRAWQVLRQKPQHFFTTDMPGNSEEAKGAGRGGYLAKQFTEFCAESFMHLALYKNELEEHVENLPDKEREVKGARASALGILLKYESQILGNPEDDEDAHEQAQATLRTHRFITALQELKDALVGPNLEVKSIEKAKANLDRLRVAWKGLTDTERAQNRLDALKSLDEYIMRIQRRRPAQAWLGPELGFGNI